jgi:hypothetical protein
MTLQDEIIQKITAEINAKIEAELLLRLEKLNLSHCIPNKYCRFPRITIEQQGGIKRYYADNGTEEGVLVMTVEYIVNYPEFVNDRFELNSNIKIT